MSDFAIIGKKGSGKSLNVTWIARKFLISNLKVASNIDFFLERLLPPSSKATYTRLPDFPRGEDLWSIGKGSESFDESTYGALILDELTVFLNARNWREGGRDKFISYLRHTRKEGWHTFLLAQGLKSIDSQIREELLDHRVICRRTDKLPIPIIGKLLKFLAFDGRFFRMHIGVVRYGMEHNAPHVDTWFLYPFKWLQQSYNTGQIFDGEPKIETVTVPYHTLINGVLVNLGIRQSNISYNEAAYTVLSAWHLKGRYLPWYFLRKTEITVFVFILIFIYGSFTFKNFLTDFFSAPSKVIHQGKTATLKKIECNLILDNGIFAIAYPKNGERTYITNIDRTQEKPIYTHEGKIYEVTH